MVDDCSDWKVNDRIVVTSTSHTDGTNESEVHIIAAISGSGPTAITIGALSGFAYKHYGATDVYSINGDTK